MSSFRQSLWYTGVQQFRRLHVVIVPIVMAFAIAACAGRQDTPPPVTAEALETSVLAHYHGRILHLFGRVTSDLDSSVHITDFSATASATRLDLHWSSLGYEPGSDSRGHLLLTPSTGDVTMSVGTTVVPTGPTHLSPAMALAEATGVSAGSAPVVNAIRMGDGRSLFPLTPTLQEHGDTCVLAGLDAAGDRKVITITNHAQIILIHTETSTAHLTSIHPLLPTDDASIRKTLLSMGSPATDQDVDRYQSMIARVETTISTSRGPMLTDIVLSERPLASVPRPTIPAPPVRSPSAARPPATVPLAEATTQAMAMAIQVQDSSDIVKLGHASIALGDVSIRIHQVQIANIEHNRSQNAGLEGIDGAGVDAMRMVMYHKIEALAAPDAHPQPPSPLRQPTP